MIRIRHENVVPVIVDSVYEEYEYKIRNGEFELSYMEWAGLDEPSETIHVGKNWNPHYDRIYLELETPAMDQEVLLRRIPYCTHDGDVRL